jgi:ParB/RepB/Spo0J family partition protein
MNDTAPITAEPAPAATIAIDDLVDGSYGNFPISLIRISRTNRKRFDEQALRELSASIEDKGLIQPILIRPVVPTEAKPQSCEIVAGERRFRASIMAGLETIPAIYRVLSDLQAAEIQILENLQREDPHPLEEAEGYEQLMMKHGYNADQLADKIKKSRSYIYARLKLCALTTDARAKFLDNEIPASTALLIARIPVPALQVRALGEILKPNQWATEPLSYREAVKHIQNRYTLDLAKATFPIADAKLSGVAPSCGKCPKRTGNQPEIFSDLSPDLCTDPDCYAEKDGAHTARTLANAIKQGLPVYEGQEANRERATTYTNTGAQVTLSTPLFYLARPAPATGMEGTVGQYLAADQLPAPVGYLQDDRGHLAALYDRVAVQSALELAGVCESVEAHAKRLAEAPKNNKKETAADAVQKARADERDAAEAEAASQTAFRVALYKQLRRRDGDGPSLELVRAAAKHALAARLALPDDLLGDLYEFDGSKDAEANAYIDAAPLPDVLQILIDMIFGELLGVTAWELSVHHRETSAADLEILTNLAKSTGVDIEKVRQSLLPEAPPELPSHAALDYATEADLGEFIGANPDRIDELTQAVFGHPRGELNKMLERAGKACGYTYGTEGWSKGIPPSPTGTAEESDPSDGDDLAGQLAEAESAPAPDLGKPAAAKKDGKAPTADKSKRKK